MSCWLYILKSESSKRYYVGVSVDPNRRLDFHNTVEKGFTAHYRPWRIVYLNEYSGREEALRAERIVKRWKSRRMIERLINRDLTL